MIGFIPGPGGIQRGMVVRRISPSTRWRTAAKTCSSRGRPRSTSVSSPTLTNVFDPATLPLPDTELAELMANLALTTQVYPARFFSIPTPTLNLASDLTPPSASEHFHVIINAPGGAGPVIQVGLEALTVAGQPLPNMGQGFPPAKAVDPATLAQLKIDLRSRDAPIHTVPVYRMSADSKSPYYNTYISRPFVVIYEKVTVEQLAELQSALKREILWGGAYLEGLSRPGDGEQRRAALLCRHGGSRRFAHLSQGAGHRQDAGCLLYSGRQPAAPTLPTPPCWHFRQHHCAQRRIPFADDRHVTAQSAHGHRFSPRLWRTDPTRGRSGAGGISTTTSASPSLIRRCSRPARKCPWSSGERKRPACWARAATYYGTAAPGALKLVFKTRAPTCRPNIRLSLVGEKLKLGH